MFQSKLEKIKCQDTKRLLIDMLQIISHQQQKIASLEKETFTLFQRTLALISEQKVKSKTTKKVNDSNCGKKWTKEHEQILKEYLDDTDDNINTIIDKLSKILLRTRYAIWCRLYLLGFDIELLILFDDDRIQRYTCFHQKKLCKLTRKRFINMFHNDISLEKMYEEADEELVVNFLHMQDLIEFE
jgi:hypothetical protein